MQKLELGSQKHIMAGPLALTMMALMCMAAPAAVLPIEGRFGTEAGCTADLEGMGFMDMQDSDIDFETWAVVEDDYIEYGPGVVCEALSLTPSRMGPARIEAVCGAMGGFAPDTLLLVPHDDDPDGIGIYLPDTDTHFNLSRCD